MVEFALNHAWLVPLLPALAFVMIVFLTRPWPRISSTLSIAAIFSSFVLASFIAYGVFTNPHFIEKPLVYSLRWFGMEGFTVHVGVMLDPTSTMMIFMVSLVATLIQIYSTGYMEGDPQYSVFFSYLSLFAASMLGLVISGNLLQMFVMWELVGLCSFLLIGFYTFKVSAREAAKKAFITTRIGDFGMMLGLLFLQIVFGTLDLTELAQRVPHFAQYGISLELLTIIAVLLFIGPIGKSGQFPLHVWLPDAMEGPTPVSALIHAATMVVAGVYLVGRTLFLFTEVPGAMEVVAFTGAFTALFAATIAVTQREIKRILAYSTVSQLGYMMLALGVGSLSASMFHLWTHAFFKALMFLGAGSVLHALHHKADVWEMGGLLKKMPITGWTFVVGGLAIAGIPPFAGFWSKDEILAVTLAYAQHGHPLGYVLFSMATLTAFLTAFYMWRMIFLAFFGKEKPENHPHESPWNMTLPLIVLAVLAAAGGLVGTPWANLWSQWIHYGQAHHGEPVIWLMVLSVVLAVAGIGLAYLLYYKDEEKKTARQLAVRFATLYRLSYNKYYVDELYLWFTRRVVDAGANLLYWFDIYVVDGIVNGLAGITRGSGQGLRYLQTGKLQTYALVFFLAVLVITVVLAFGDTSAAGVIGGGKQ
ncbi:NADH-quinone oxidoreductase subunit L [Desulforamulus hydrothermalis]|uniref:NAD(P)H-quinone oxidoreductase chain 5 n=1 Tax=Desulforamulus hydrothermalis Lam5 = DSM 18033 TaxID=1121428 RepID=K8DZF3_9FIRM|nr:NADH-quinone oxidoreductase subunit L [Desulforamulus hydrothermalis]CCO08462.1 NAD(P)H-quinone oxidoreductase chain 5 [Desulforamulus hydrothermalis Lam5 = DSM 18033]SHH28951.1 NADH dehydrogenase subunit L [Desulforamulus hydrothermalis Lam5 = DSM 18033]